MELIDAYEPESHDSNNPNVMRIIWHVVLFGCMLVCALLILVLHPLSRKILLVNYNEKETININYPIQTQTQNHQTPRLKKKKNHHQEQTKTDETSESESD